MKVSVETIGPKKADEYLKKVSPAHQRKFRKRLGMQYAEEMKNGEFDETGESIIFDIKDRLVQGQHRMFAVKESGKEYEFAVVRGVNETAVTKMDTGLKRTASDVLHMEGSSHSTSISSQIRKYIILKKGKVGAFQKTRGITNDTILKEYRKRKKWWEDVNTNVKEWKREIDKALSPSDIGGLYAYLGDKSSNEASTFFVRLCLGTELKNTSPIWVLRQTLLRKRETELKSLVKTAYVVKAWNAFRQGDKIEKLSFDPKKEGFPKAI
jgi:hypothetical protein